MRLKSRFGRAAARRLALGALLALPACHPRAGLEDVREHLVFREDFEQLHGWLPDPEGTLTTERAHSGRYAVRVSKEHPFSITYRIPLGEVSTQRPRRFRLSAWVWVANSDEAARLVFNINSLVPGAPASFSTRLYLNDYWPYQRWTYVSRDIDIPPSDYGSQNKLSVFLWHNEAHEVVFADDWELTELH